MGQRYGDEATPKWNFHKLLFSAGPERELVAVFGHSISPTEPEVTEALEEEVELAITDSVGKADT